MEYSDLLLSSQGREYLTLQELCDKSFWNEYGLMPSITIRKVFQEEYYYKPLAKRFDEIGIRKLSYISGGQNCHIFLSTKNQIVRILNQRHENEHDEPEILSPIVKFTAFEDGEKLYPNGFEIYPEVIPLTSLLDRNFARDLAINEGQAVNIVDMLDRRLIQKGLTFYGCNIQNVGILLDGTPVVLDPGDVFDYGIFEDYIESENINHGLKWDGVFDGKQAKHMECLGLSYGHVYGAFRKPRPDENVASKWTDYIQSSAYVEDVRCRRF